MRRRTDVTKREQTLTDEGVRPRKSYGLDNQMGQLQTSHNDLVSHVSELKGNVMMVGLVFLVISIVFTALSGLAGYKIYTHQKMEDARAEYQELLVDQFQKKTEESINHVAFGGSSDNQHYVLQELAEMLQRLEKLNIESERFVVRAELARAAMSMIDHDDAKALQTLEQLKKRTAYSDPFVYSRALTLHAILLLRPTRSCGNPAIRSLVEEAVKRDSGLAAAFNVLGLCLTEEAVGLAKSPSEDGWLSGARKMREAFKHYELSYVLRPSAWALSKSLNNKIWGNLVFLETALGNEARTKKLLTLNGYNDFEHFVNDSLKDLALCKTLSPSHPVWAETEAELHGLRNAYYIRKNQQDNAAAAVVEMRTQYREAIKRGLFAGRRRREEAIEYFKSDSLLEKLHDDREILELIEKSVSAGM